MPATTPRAVLAGYAAEHVTSRRVLDRSKNRASVLSVRAIRRFTVRPVLPEPLAPLGELASNLRWSWHPETQDVFAAVDADAVGVQRPRPGPAPRRGLAASGSTSSPATSDFLRAARRWPAPTCERVPHRRPLVPALGRPSAPDGDRLLLARSSASPRCCRSTPAASASSPATTSRPPATSASRSSASACSTGTATSGSRCPARAGSRRPTRSLDPDGLPLTLLREADGTPRDGRASPCPAAATLVARSLASPRSAGCRCCCSTPTSRRTRRPLRDVTDRLYGGSSEHRLRQELLLGVGGVRALRALLAHHRRPGARGLPHQRGPRRLPRPRADPRAHRGRRRLDFDTALEVGPRRHRLHHPHPGARPASTGSRASWSSSTSAATAPTPGVPVDRILALGAEDYEGGDPAVFNMAVMGFRLAQRANGVSPAARPRVSRGMFNGLWPGFDEAEVPITSITNGVHAPTWVAREVFELAGRRSAPTRRATTPRLGRRRQGPRRRASGRPSATLRERLVDDAREPAARVVAAARRRRRPSSAGSTTCSTPTC